MLRAAEALKQILDAVEEAIQEVGEVPSGHLYAMLLEHMSLDDYQCVIGMLKRRGTVTEDASHLLRAVKAKGVVAREWPRRKSTLMAE